MDGKGVPEVGMTRSQSGLPCLTVATLNEREKALIETTLQAVAHEIRNPLMVIGAFARRLVDSLDASSPSARYAEILLREALRLEMLLSVMIDENGYRNG
jgi:signal transduction histidine kinase